MKVLKMQAQVIVDAYRPEVISKLPRYLTFAFFFKFHVNCNRTCKKKKTVSIQNFEVL